MKLLVKIIMLLIGVASVNAQIQLSNPPAYVVPIATPYVASWTLATSNANSGLAYLGGLPTNGTAQTVVSGIIISNAVLTNASNSTVSANVYGGGGGGARPDIMDW